MAREIQNGTILVADDNANIRQFAKVFLENAGWNVVTAADGEEALRIYHAHQSAIVLLLTDVIMPNLDGYALADRVQAIDSKLPVLLMSGDQVDAYRGLECLEKPFHPAELVDKVSRLLRAGSHPATRAAAAPIN